MKKIPKIIHQIVIDKNTVNSSHLTELAHTWKQNHPDWQYKEWDKNLIETFIINNFPDIYPLFCTCKNNVQRSLLARYLLLYQQGGLLVDIDFECIAPFDELIKGKSCCFSLEPNNDPVLSDSFIISTKKNPFLQYVVSIIANLNTSDADSVLSDPNVFITNLYNSYPNKREVSLIPSDVVIPCTQSEIRAYIKGSLSEDIMESKITNALSICYYTSPKHIYKFIGKADILYLSSFVGDGGAPKAAERIHSGLLDIGIKSVMLTMHSSMPYREDICIATPENDEIYGRVHEMKYLTDFPKMSHLFSPATVGIDIHKYIGIFNPEVVQLHWINGGFVKIEDLGEIKKKIVWRLPDCWAFTGGCHYFGNCTRYINSCGRCPILKSDKENDLSRSVWMRKSKAWGKMDMTIVVPSLWMKEKAERSSLFREYDIHIIPNGLNLEIFYPTDKTTARKMLGLPADKKIILYGAANAIGDPRKGFNLLLQALQLLSERCHKDYYFVIFGTESQKIDINFYVKFMGYIRDCSILQTLYSAADVMIVPSLEEAFGQTVTEAMACATPVVSFLETGPAGIVEHKQTGYLARYADVEDLAKGIEWILSDDYIINFLSNNAVLSTQTSYDIKVVAKQYQSLYESI